MPHFLQVELPTTFLLSISLSYCNRFTSYIITDTMKGQGQGDFSPKKQKIILATIFTCFGVAVGYICVYLPYFSNYRRPGAAPVEAGSVPGSMWSNMDRKIKEQNEEEETVERVRVTTKVLK